MQSLLAQLVQAMPGWGQGGAHECNFLIWRWSLKWFQMGFSSFCIDDLRKFEMGLREYRWPSHGQWWPVVSALPRWHRSWSDLAGLGSRSIQTILSLILALLGSALSETQYSQAWYPWWLDVLVNHSSEHVPPVYSSAGRCSMPRPSIPWWNCKTQWRNCGRLSAWGTKVIDGIWGDLLVNNKHRFSKLQQHAVPLLITVQQLQETHPAGSTTTIRGWFGDFLLGPINRMVVEPDVQSFQTIVVERNVCSCWTNMLHRF